MDPNVFAPRDLYPMRSPMIVADFLAELTAGGAFAEIGTRDGDIVKCVRELGARTAYAIEQSSRRWPALHSRGGLSVVEEHLNASNAERVIPNADVFYSWSQPEWYQNFAELTHKVLLARGRSAFFVMGYDWHEPKDQPWFVNHNRWLRSEQAKSNGTRFRDVRIQRLHYEEEEEEEGWVAKNSTMTWARFKRIRHATGDAVPETPRAVYTSRVGNRPGFWGVWHLLVCTIGK